MSCVNSKPHVSDARRNCQDGPVFVLPDFTIFDIPMPKYLERIGCHLNDKKANLMLQVYTAINIIIILLNICINSYLP